MTDGTDLSSEVHGQSRQFRGAERMWNTSDRAAADSRCDCDRTAETKGAFWHYKHQIYIIIRFLWGLLSQMIHQIVSNLIKHGTTF